jgi:glucosamine--fructose-6-phosphate aminotransferase (isomerizing)
MCGIVGYVGPRSSGPLLLEALKRLEYRGYDSCGIAVLDNGTPKVVRTAGRIAGLEARVLSTLVPNAHDGQQCGIGHTRWATHGRPCEENSHPHTDCSGRIFVVHNGIIENHLELKRRLKERGHQFRTQTDSEVLPHLIESHWSGSLEAAVRAAIDEIEGIYAFVAVAVSDGLKIVAARQGPPLVVGVGPSECFIASDAPALLPFTQQLLYLENGEVATLTADAVRIVALDGHPRVRKPQCIEWTAERAEKEGYSHFMLKEIFEQPSAIRETLRCHGVRNGHPPLSEEVDATRLERVERVHVVACGTSLHAGLVGKHMIQSLARLPVEVSHASEFRYEDKPIGPNDLVVGITQSGETADTLAALEESQGRALALLSICNVVGSSVARLSDYVLYTHAGPEIGVASTKAFTSQLAVLHLLAVYLGRLRGVLDEDTARRHLESLEQVPDLMQNMLDRPADLEALARRLQSSRGFLYLGRGVSYPIALEGALKLKEISYVHAEGYPAGEMKHGPIALVDADLPAIVVVPRDRVYRKTVSNIEEVRVRDARVIAIATDGDEEIENVADEVLRVPGSDPLLSPLLTVLPLQLLAYHSGVLRGLDVDKPRNLAKSVTVE